jgi:hypothetical protein
MKRERTNDDDPQELFRSLPHGIRLKIYRFTVHVFDSRQELIEVVDLFVQTHTEDKVDVDVMVLLPRGGRIVPSPSGTFPE